MPLFLHFRLFNAVDGKQRLNINYAEDWIWTLDLWYWKRLLYQLSHNDCPILAYLEPHFETVNYHDNYGF